MVMVPGDTNVPATTTASEQVLHKAHDPEAHSVQDRSDTSSEAQAQDGVKQVEAITTVWSKELLIVMYCL